MINEESRKRYSEASKARQAKIPPEVRKAWMSVVGKKRWEGVSAEDRRAYSLKMVLARTNKKNELQNKTGSEGRDQSSAFGPSGASSDGSVVDAGGGVVESVTGV